VPAPLILDVAAAGGAGLLGTALVLGIRHGFDWDHIAAIADVTSTTTVAEAAEEVHEAAHAAAAGDETPGIHPVDAQMHIHTHGGPAELAAHQNPDAHAHVAGSGTPIPGHVAVAAVRPHVLVEQRRALILGTLYALGHALVVAILGTLALLFGTVLPDWVDPIMGRVVGVTLVLLGTWVFVSLYQYVRHGRAFRLRSRWMLVFDTFRYGWRRLQARLHGHEHVEPLEMSSYGPRTAFGVGMIHGIGAETATQVLFIAAIGGAQSIGLGIPMMLAFIIGLVITNTLIVVVSASGFLASQGRRQLYLIVGAIAGGFSLVIGAAFLFGLEDILPNLEHLFG